jgi:F-type H+-transporting ATPase subunit a
MLIASGGFSWFHLFVPGLDGNADNLAIASAWFVAGVLCLIAFAARLGLESARERNGLDRYVPDEGFTLLNAAEVFVSGLQGMMADIMEKVDAKYFFPFIGSLFAYIFTCNIMAIFPGFQPPTDNINTNFGMAVLVFAVFNTVGLKRDAVGYLKHLTGPVLFLAPLMIVIEIVSLFLRPITLSLRLTANIFADHLVFGIMSDLVSLIVPSIFLGMAIFVSVMQALVFSLLTTVYLSLAIPHHDEGGHGHDDHH